MKGLKVNKHMGKEVVDEVTGFTGTITAFCQYITGCDQYCVMPKAKDSMDYPKSIWLDCNRLKIINNTKIVLNTKIDNGADQAAPANY